MESCLHGVLSGEQLAYELTLDDHVERLRVHVALEPHIQELLVQRNCIYKRNLKTRCYDTRAEKTTVNEQAIITARIYFP